MVVVIGYGKSWGNGRTFFGVEIHLCILFSLPKTPNTGPQKSGWTRSRSPGITWKVSEIRRRVLEST